VADGCLWWGMSYMCLCFFFFFKFKFLSLQKIEKEIKNRIAKFSRKKKVSCCELYYKFMVNILYYVLMWAILCRVISFASVTVVIHFSFRVSFIIWLYEDFCSNLLVKLV
jgi:hypothetical protein